MKLSTPIVNIVLEQPDGTQVEYTVQTDNRDSVRWDLVRGRKNWPTGQDAPMLWITFLAWHAMTRSKATTLSIEQFLESCVQASVDKEQQVDVDPTQEAAAAAS